MSPGTILFDPNFKYSDGTTGEKIFIVLNDATNENYLAVKCTSKGSRYFPNYGCQLNHKFPFFFLPRGSCCLSENTWVQLDEYFELICGDLLRRVMTCEVTRIGLLPVAIAAQLVSCASNSDDIPTAWIEVCSRVHEKITGNPSEE